MQNLHQIQHLKLVKFALEAGDSDTISYAIKIIERSLENDFSISSALLDSSKEDAGEKKQKTTLIKRGEPAIFITESPKYAVPALTEPFFSPPVTFPDACKVQDAKSPTPNFESVTEGSLPENKLQEMKEWMAENHEKYTERKITFSDLLSKIAVLADVENPENLRELTNKLYKQAVIDYKNRCFSESLNNSYCVPAKKRGRPKLNSTVVSELAKTVKPDEDKDEEEEDLDKLEKQYQVESAEKSADDYFYAPITQSVHKIM